MNKAVSSETPPAGRWIQMHLNRSGYPSNKKRGRPVWEIQNWSNQFFRPSLPVLGRLHPLYPFKKAKIDKKALFFPVALNHPPTVSKGTSPGFVLLLRRPLFSQYFSVIPIP